MRRASSLSFLLRLCIGGSRVAWDDSDAGAVDLVGQLHQPPEHDGGEEGAAGRGDPVHRPGGGHGDGEAGRDLEWGYGYHEGVSLGKIAFSCQEIMTHLRPLGGEAAPEEALFEVADGGEEKEEEEGADQAADDGHDGCGGNHRFQDLKSTIKLSWINSAYRYSLDKLTTCSSI